MRGHLRAGPVLQQAYRIPCAVHSRLTFVPPNKYHGKVPSWSKFIIKDILYNTEGFKNNNTEGFKNKINKFGGIFYEGLTPLPAFLLRTS